jgi:hypothetical protein
LTVSEAAKAEGLISNSDGSIKTLDEYKKENAKAKAKALGEISGKADDAAFSKDKMMEMIEKYDRAQNGDAADYDKSLAEIDTVRALIKDKVKKTQELRTIASAEIIKESTFNVDKRFGEMNKAQRDFFTDDTLGEMEFKGDFAGIVKRWDAAKTYTSDQDFINAGWSQREIDRYKKLAASSGGDFTSMEEIIDIYRILGDPDSPVGQGDSERARRDNWAKVTHMAAVKRRAEMKGQEVSDHKSYINSSERTIEESVSNLAQLKSRISDLRDVEIKTVEQIYELTEKERQDYSNLLYNAAGTIVNANDQLEANQTIRALITAATTRKAHDEQLGISQKELSEANAVISKFMSKTGGSVVRPN